MNCNSYNEAQRNFDLHSQTDLDQGLDQIKRVFYERCNQDTTLKSFFFLQKQIQGVNRDMKWEYNEILAQIGETWPGCRTSGIASELFWDLQGIERAVVLSC